MADINWRLKHFNASDGIHTSCFLPAQSQNINLRITLDRMLFYMLLCSFCTGKIDDKWNQMEILDQNGLYFVDITC